MKNKKILEFTLESLVHETFNIVEPSDLNGIKLEYNAQSKSYRLDWKEHVLDFPRSLKLIDDLLSVSYLDLKSYDCDLYNGLRELLNTSEEIHFYVYGEDIFLSFDEYSDIKKAA